MGLLNYLRANGWLLLTFSIFVSGLIVAIWFFIKLSKDYSAIGYDSVDITKSGAVGDFIAGVVGTLFTLGGAIFVYLTYREQIDANEKEKIESRFFTLIQIHVENANNIAYNNPYKNGD